MTLHAVDTWSERAYEGPGDPLSAVVADADRLRETNSAVLLTEYVRRAARSRLGHASPSGTAR